MNRVSIKKGDTFSVVCQYNGPDGQPIDLVATATSVASQVRTLGGQLLADLTVNILDQNTNRGQYQLSSATSLWPVGTHAWDIQYTKDGVISSTDTVSISVISGVTE